MNKPIKGVKFNRRKPLPRMPNVPPENKGSSMMMWIIFSFIIIMLLSQSSVNMSTTPKELKYSEFYALLKDNSMTSKIKSGELTENEFIGTFSDD